MTLVQTELKSMKICKSWNFATQWPSPDGFHVPSKDERVALCWILTDTFGLADDGETMVTYLKMPLAGLRHYASAGVYYQGTDACYWSSTAYSADDAYRLDFGWAGLNPQYRSERSDGFSVRCFKDTPVIPDSNWTTLYQGTWSAWIFRNSSLWLISVNWGWQTWFTIMDKNLWATTIYNDGDTLSQANCWNYYQRWNNYGFPWTWSVTTSSTQVDASGYWPWNYYSSSTFITMNDDWSSVQNDNLWWWVTWNVPMLEEKEIKRVTIRPNGTERQIRPAERTFTVTFTETSNPSQFNPVYSDDAAWLTAWSTDFDEFFGYSAVRLSTAWVETAEITQAQSGWNGKLDITQLWTLTSGDNVMIKFPVRWIKMSKNGSAVTLSITDGLGRESEWYQYYSFQNTWDIEANANNTVTTKPLYIWAYLAYNNSSTLKSWSGQTPSYYTLENAITYAWNNGTWYTIMGYYQRQYISALYMMKYGNPDGQTQIGRWYVWGSSYASTWWTNSQTYASYWTTSNTTQMKLFGLEDYRWNKYQWIGWLFLDSSKNVYTALHTFTTSTSTSQTQYKNTGSAIPWNWELKEIVGNNKAMFLPLSQVSNSSYNTYYCDNTVCAANRFAVVGWDKGNGSQCWVFNIYADNDASKSWDYLASRIMYL